MTGPSWYERVYERWPFGNVVYISAAGAAGTGYQTTYGNSQWDSAPWVELQELAEAIALAKAAAKEHTADDRRVRKRAPPVAFEWGAYMHPVRPARAKSAEPLPSTPRGPGPYTRKGALVTTSRYGRVTLAAGRTKWKKGKGRHHRRW